MRGTKTGGFTCLRGSILNANQQINASVDICTNNDGELTDFLPNFNKKLDKNIIRSKSVLPFTKRLCVDMVLDLYTFVRLPVTDVFYKFINDERCKKLSQGFT